MARLAVLSLLGLSRGVVAIAVASQYQLQATYRGDTFFNNFNFVTGDPNGDFVNYVDYSTALDNGQIAVDSTGAAYIMPDTSTVLNPNGVGRDSVKIVSTASWTHGLFITDLKNMPGGVCGVSARHYLTGATLANGEIDIITGINNAAYDQMTLFTQPTCSVAGDGQIGTSQSTDCSAASGCSVLYDSDPNSFGDNFNSNGGGVFATEWTSDYIRIWFFDYGTTPFDITAGTPDPTLWGEPVSNFQGSCNIDGSFSQNSITFDLDFCTTIVEANWAADGCNSLAATCREYVASFPADLSHYNDFDGVYWGINSVKVYQIASVSSSSSSTSTSSTATSSSVSSSSTSPAAASSSTYSASSSSSVPSAATSSTSSTTTSSSAAVSSSVYSSASSSSAVDPASSSTSSYGSSSSSSSSVISSVSSSSTTDGPSSSVPASTTASASITTSSSYPYFMLPSTSSLPPFITLPSSSSCLPTPTSPPSYTTSTVYRTTIYTITSCAATVTDCPARIGSLTTETISLYTTVCPVEEAETATATPPAQPVESYSTTVIVTTYTSICPTGPTVITATSTLTIPLSNPASKTPPGALTTGTITYTSPDNTVTLQLTTPRVMTVLSTVSVQPVVSSSTSASIQSPAGNSPTSATGTTGPVTTVEPSSSGSVMVPTATPSLIGTSGGMAREWSLGTVVVAFVGALLV